jgi:hypothetical protein
LDSINEQRVEKVNRLKVSEKERDNLSGSKLEAEQYIEKDKDIRRKKNALYQMLGSSAEHKVVDMTDALDKATNSATEERAKLAEIESGMKSIKKEYDLINNEYNTVSAEQQRFSLVSFSVILMRSFISCGADEYGCLLFSFIFLFCSILFCLLLCNLIDLFLCMLASTYFGGLIAIYLTTRNMMPSNAVMLNCKKI